MSFTFPSRLKGHGVRRCVNNGVTDVHELQLVKLLPGKKLADLMAWWHAKPGTVPPRFTFAGGAGVLAPQYGAALVGLFLRPGNYVATCFVPDEKPVSRMVPPAWTFLSPSANPAVAVVVCCWGPTRTVNERRCRPCMGFSSFRGNKIIIPEGPLSGVTYNEQDSSGRHDRRDGGGVACRDGVAGGVGGPDPVDRRGE